MIDKGELRTLLQAVNSGSGAGSGGSTLAQSWVVDAIVDSVMASFDGAGDSTLRFNDFAALVTGPWITFAVGSQVHSVSW